MDEVRHGTPAENLAPATAHVAPRRNRALLRISSRRPLAALVELISERRAGLVVLGPDVRRTPRWQVWLAARRVRLRTDCLIWIAPDG